VRRNIVGTAQSSDQSILYVLVGILISGPARKPAHERPTPDQQLLARIVVCNMTSAGPSSFECWLLSSSGE
jgi:hypothetical protein